MRAAHPFPALALLALAAGPSGAQTGAPNEAQTVIVTGSVRGQRVADAPYAITAVDEAALREAGPMVNLSEALARVPGLVAANRHNYAQDLQISSRGFGARATFGVRGIRLYSDGIPASGPDGQGQVAHFDLAGAARVEVLRGPFSVLYGSSSGGVISVFSAPVKQQRFEIAADAGRFGMTQVRGSAAAPLGRGLDLKLNLSGLSLAGFRPQSAAERQLASLRLGWQDGADALVLNYSQHEQQAEDPLGLTPAEFSANARGTTASAISFNTRKTISQGQLGLSWRHRFGAGAVLEEFSLAAYRGERAVVQFLSIPANVQANPGHGGGVVDFNRSYEGLEARLRGGGQALAWQVGATLDRQRDARRGWENFVGSTLGVQGRLRRDEINRAQANDLFAQAEWRPADSMAATAGVRTGEAKVRVQDRYITTTNRDDSGGLDFRYTNPVLGLRWNPQPQWALHASVARGYETPTLGELAYTQNNAGFNSGLQAQSSRQLELGSKWRSGGFELDAALFAVRTQDEIGVFSNTGGRAVFQNVGRTSRHGAELAAQWRLSPRLRAQLALSVLKAEYLDTVGANVRAGNQIAGTQARTGYAQLAWQPGWMPGEVALETRGQARTAANDLNSVFAPGFGVVNLRWNHEWSLGEAGTLQTLLRLDNAANRSHVGSVIVNDANGRFFEPGSPRAWLMSVRWAKTY